MRGEGVKIDLGAKLLRLDLELYGAEQKKKTTYLVYIYIANYELKNLPSNPNCLVINIC